MPLFLDTLYIVSEPSNISTNIIAENNSSAATSNPTPESTDSNEDHFCSGSDCVLAPAICCNVLFCSLCMSSSVYGRVRKLGKVKSFLNFYFSGIWTLLLWIFTISVATVMILNLDSNYSRCLRNSGYLDIKRPEKVKWWDDSWDEYYDDLNEYYDDLSKKEWCQKTKAMRIFIAVAIVLKTFLLITIYKSLDIIWQIRKLKQAGEDKTDFGAFGLTICCLPFAYLNVRRELFLIKNEMRHRVLTV